MSYIVTVNGKTISYGAWTERSRFTNDEWSALCHQMVKENYSEDYEKYKDDETVILLKGELIQLEERYTVLIDELTGGMYSKAGTHPRWIIDNVNRRMIDKRTAYEDIVMMLFEDEGVENPVKALKEYFDIVDNEQ